MTFDEESSTYKNGRRTRGGDILSRAYVALDDIELCSSKLIDNLKYPFTRMYAHRSCDSNPANLRRVVAAIRKSDTGKQMCWDAVCLGRSEEEVRGLSTERTAAMVESGAKHYSICKQLALEEVEKEHPDFSPAETEAIRLYRERLSAISAKIPPTFVKLEKSTRRSATPIQWILQDTSSWWLLERKVSVRNKPSRVIKTPRDRGANHSSGNSSQTIQDEEQLSTTEEQTQTDALVEPKKRKTGEGRQQIERQDARGGLQPKEGPIEEPGAERGAPQAAEQQVQETAADQEDDKQATAEPAEDEQEGLSLIHI